MDPKQRIVDYALQRLYHCEPEVDLSKSVREAWESGAAGPSLHELDWEEDDWDALDREPRENQAVPHGRTRPARVSLFPTYARMAAAALILVVVTAWLLDSRVQGELAGSFSRSLPRLEADRWVPNAQENVSDGVAVWVDGREPVLVSLERGGSLEVDPGSLFTLFLDEEGTRVDLEWGSLQARADTTSPLWVSSSGTTVAVAAGGILEANLEWDRASPAPDDLHLVEPMRSRNAGGSLGLLSLSLLEGEARLTAGAGDALEAGRPLDLALEIRRSRTLPADDGVRLAQGLDDMFELTGRNWEVVGAELMRTPAWGFRPDQEFLAFAAELREEQGHWFHLRRVLQERLASPELPTYVRSEILSLLALDGGPIATALATDVWSQHPEWFKVDQVVALAESGVWVFQREMDSIAVQSDSLGIELSYLEELGTMQPFLPAVYLALYGNDVGVSLLREVASESDGDLGNAQVSSRKVLSAVALRGLGIEGPWEACRQELERVVLELLDEDDLDGAIDQVLDWEYLAGGRSGNHPPRVSFLPLRLAEHRDRRRTAFLTRENVLAQVERLLLR